MTLSTSLLFRLLICLFTAYLLGSVHPAYLIGKYKKGIDIREHGSGNSGTTNAARVMGTKVGLACLFIDGGKAALCVLITRYFVGPLIADASALVFLELLTGVFAVLGHSWPFYMKFKGGKGVASTVGVMLAVNWRLALVAAAILLFVLLTTRIMSLASLSFQVAAYIGLLVVYSDTKFILPIATVSLVFPVLSFWRHRANLIRLKNGEELPLWGKGSKKDLAKQKR